MWIGIDVPVFSPCSAPLRPRRRKRSAGLRRQRVLPIGFVHTGGLDAVVGEFFEALLSGVDASVAGLEW